MSSVVTFFQALYLESTYEAATKSCTLDQVLGTPFPSGAGTAVR